MATKPRSPNYPAVSLQKALEHARKVYAANHLHKAPRDVVAKVMGYSSLNGGSLTVISALKKYGLLEEDDIGLWISQDALTVLVESANSPERARTLVKLATSPELFGEMKAAFPGPTPNDEILRSWLLRKGFLQSTVDLPIRAYRETMELAEAQKTLFTDSSPGRPARDSDIVTEKSMTEPEPEIGDLIQWEPAGVLQFETPRRVRAKQEHEGAWWLFVEGSETGIPMDEVTVKERKTPDSEQPKGAPKAPPTLPLSVAILDADIGYQTAPGEREWLRGTLSRATSYKLLVIGEIGPKEIGKLIKLLEAQKAVLDDDDDVSDLM